MIDRPRNKVTAYKSGIPVRTEPAGVKPDNVSGFVWVDELNNDQTDWHWALYEEAECSTP